MDQRNIPWKAEWKAAGLDPGPLTPEQESLVEPLRLSNQAFLAKHPFSNLRSLHSRAPRAFFLGLPLAAAAALLLFVGVPFAPVGQVGTSLERMKGATEPALMVYRQGMAGAEKLASGTEVRPGDVLQASYRVAVPSHGALLSLDGSGNVTVHLARGGRSVALTPGEEQPLSSGYELDRAPQYEVFFLFTSDQPFDIEPLRQILKKSNWQTLPVGVFGPAIRFTLLPLAKGVRP